MINLNWYLIQIKVYQSNTKLNSFLFSNRFRHHHVFTATKLCPSVLFLRKCIPSGHRCSSDERVSVFFTNKIQVFLVSCFASNNLFVWYFQVSFFNNRPNYGRQCWQSDMVEHAVGCGLKPTDLPTWLSPKGYLYRNHGYHHLFPLLFTHIYHVKYLHLWSPPTCHLSWHPSE